MITKYLTKFNTEAEYNEFLNSSECPYINVSYIQETDENKYYKEADALMIQPFTMHIDNITSADPIPMRFTVSGENGTSGNTYIKYKLNNNDWVTNEYDKGTTVIDLVDSSNNRLYYTAGDTIQIISLNNMFCIGGPWENQSGMSYSISGNVMSTIWGDDYIYATPDKLPFPVTKKYGPWENIEYTQTNFTNLCRFENEFTLIDASDLWLPTKKLPEGIFKEMFRDRANLTAAPNIKAKYLPKYACQNMFANCTSLTDMPLILTETCEEKSLDGMFYRCAALVNTTQLHFKKFIGNNMNSMFQECTSLVTAPIWDEDVIFQNINPHNWDCFNYIFNGCSLLEDTSTFYIRAKDLAIFNNLGFGSYARNCPNLRSLFKMGLSNPSDGSFTFSSVIPSGDSSDTLQSNGEIYILTTTGEIQIDGDANRFQRGGTVYVLPGSRYLPDGDLYGQLPTNLPSNWTVAEYVEPSN